MPEGGPYVVYGAGATFSRRCPKCGRIVEADDTVRFDCQGFGRPAKNDNATCKQCGRVEMPWEGWEP